MITPWRTWPWPVCVSLWTGKGGTVVGATGLGAWAEHQRVKGRRGLLRGAQIRTEGTFRIVLAGEVRGEDSGARCVISAGWGSAGDPRSAGQTCRCYAVVGAAALTELNDESARTQVSAKPRMEANR